MLLAVLIVAVCLLFFFYEFHWKRRRFPAGPCPVPLFGNLLALNNNPNVFDEWSREYGEMYTFWIGNTPNIMINSLELMKETFVREPEVFVDKKRQPMLGLFRGGEYGILDTNGDVWRQHRRFALSSLRDFGVGKNLMEEKILIEVQDLFLKFDHSLGIETDVPCLFENAVANVINQLLFGYRFDEDRRNEFRELKRIIDAPQQLFGKFSMFLAMNIPILARVFPKSWIETPIVEFRDHCYQFFNEQVEEHLKHVDFSSETNSDYVEAFLKEQRIRGGGDGDEELFSNRQLTNICMDLWFAGLGTSSNTIGWALSYALHAPDVQRRLHEELDRVVAGERLVTTSDKSRLVYLNAFINETQRCANIVPLNFQHATTRDTVIRGFHVAKGTGVVAQISTVMSDPKTFPDPHAFNPDRFIENGRLRRVDELIPFSIGKRQCLGEGLARMELFLFLANFFNRYHISASRDGPPSLEKNSGSVLAPREFTAILAKRRT